MTTVQDVYRAVRRSQWEGMARGWTYSAPAKHALQVARDEVALRKVEAEDGIRFQWETDEWYEPFDVDDEGTEHERQKLASGEWEALNCMAQIPTRACPHCGQTMPNELGNEWQTVASLGGIVIDVNDKYDYKREVERELAADAGVI